MMVPGYLLIRKNVVPESVLKHLSQIIVKVLYPALIFSSIIDGYSLQGVIQSWQLPVSTFITMIIGYSIGLVYMGFFKKIDLQKKKSILFQMTINNFSFLPLAIIAKLYDEQHMAALILSTLGAELTVWTIGMSILNKKEGKFDINNLKHLLSPPLMSIYFSLFVLCILYVFNWSLDSVLEQSTLMNYSFKTIQQIGQATIPISMIMVGGRMGKIKFGDLKDVDIWSVTFFRLVLIPLVCIGALYLLFPEHPFLKVMLIVAVMPNSIASLVVGELYGADQKLMSGTVLVTHMVSLFTIPLWLMMLL